MDDLLSSLPELSWSEVFLAVNRMSGDGRLRLLQVGFSTYVLVPDPPQLETPGFRIPPVPNIHHGGFPDRAA